MTDRERFPSLNEPTQPGARGWLQWKGTEACIDITCPCGYEAHFDGSFCYHVKCPQCNQVYEVGGHVRLYPLDWEPPHTILLDESL